MDREWCIDYRSLQSLRKVAGALLRRRHGAQTRLGLNVAIPFVGDHEKGPDNRQVVLEDVVFRHVVDITVVS